MAIMPQMSTRPSSFGIAAVVRLTDVQVGSFTSIPPFVEGFSLFNLLC